MKKRFSDEQIIRRCHVSGVLFTSGASATCMFHAADGFWVTSVNSRHVEKRTARCLR